MKLKKTAKLEGAQLPIIYALGVAEVVFGQYNKPCIVTSILDDAPQRLRVSLHQKGMAADLRTHHLNKEQGDTIIHWLRLYLEPLGYDVVDERNRTDRAAHIHLEYDAKPGENWITPVE